MRGIVSREIGGKVVNFHFGTAMFEQLEEKGLSLSNFKDAMSEKMFSTTTEILYQAAIAWCKVNKKDVDFDRVDVTCWVDEMGINEAVNLITEGLKVLEKNPKALENQG